MIVNISSPPVQSPTQDSQTSVLSNQTLQTQVISPVRSSIQILQTPVLSNQTLQTQARSSSQVLSNSIYSDENESPETPQTVVSPATVKAINFGNSESYQS